MRLLVFHTWGRTSGLPPLGSKEVPRTDGFAVRFFYAANIVTIPYSVAVFSFRWLAQSEALRFGSILALSCLSPDAISHPASFSLSLQVSIVA
jgi:hypothetical protein